MLDNWDYLVCGTERNKVCVCVEITDITLKTFRTQEKNQHMYNGSLIKRENFDENIDLHILNTKQNKFKQLQM
jgi:hypothetical protein